MANQKISDYTALTGANVDDAADLIEIVDTGVSTNKKILVRELKNAFLVIGTEQASTSGTEIDFTGIPAGVRRITIMLVGVSISGTDDLIIQLGDAGGFENSGYVSTVVLPIAAGATVASSSTAGFIFTSGTTAASVLNGKITLDLERASTFYWVACGNINQATTAVASSAGAKATSAELTQVRITSVNGSVTFDAGVINISYE